MEDQFGNPTASSTRNPYRVILLIVVIIAILAAIGIWLAGYFGKGTLVINTNDKANIINIIAPGANSSIAQGKGNLTVKLHTGDYVAVVSDSASSTKQNVRVKAHRINSYKVSIQNLVEAEPVLPFGAYGVLADNSLAYYADMRDHLLYKVAADGHAVPVNRNIRFGKVVWQNANYGVGEDLNNKNIYSITSGTVKKISLPFNAGQLTFDLSPNGHLVVSDGSAVYIEESGTFRKIFSSHKITSLAAGNNGILVGVSDESGGDSDQASFEILNYQGMRVGSKDTSAYSYAWSPDGKYLAITNDSSTIIYDSRFRKVTALPEVNVLGMKWLNANTLLYGAGSNLFSYNLEDGDAAQLTTLSDGGVSGIYPSIDGRQIYILDQISNNTNLPFRLSRIRLQGSAPGYIYQLGVFLPVQINNCYVSYVNFTRFLVTVFPAQPSAYGACLQSAKSYLVKDQVDISKLSFSEASAK